MKNKIVTFCFCLITQIILAQTFTKRDSLQGGLSFERTCFDVLHYALDITTNPDEKFISGVNHIAFKIVENTKRIQLDLFENMKVDSIVLWDKRKMFSLNKDSSSGESLKYKRKYDAVFIDFEEELKKGEDYIIRFYYSGDRKSTRLNSSH